MRLRVLVAQDRLGDVVLADQRRGGFEVRRQRQHLTELTAKRAGGPGLERQGARGLLRVGQRDVHLAVAEPLATALAVAPDSFGVGLRVHVSVADACSQVDRVPAEPRHDDRGRLVRQREHRCLFHGVVGADVRLRAAPPQQPHHFDGLLEHLAAHAARGPSVTQDVLVQRLAGTDAEEEAPRHHHGRRGGGLRDHGRVDARGGAGHGRSHVDPVGDGRDPAQHGPDERALPLTVRPWVVVVGDGDEAEPDLLRTRGAPHHADRIELLAREVIADLHRG